MSDRMIIEQWDFDTMTTVDKSVDGILAKEFINWILNNASWKEYPELLIERAFAFRKKALADLRPAEDPLREKGVKQRPGDGRFVARAK